MKNDIFNDWLDKEFAGAQQKLSANEPLNHDDKMAVMLKYQTNHISHLEHDVNTRFNDVDKRFNEVDKRFNEVDKRFNELRTEIGIIRSEINNLTWKFIMTLIASQGLLAALIVGGFTFIK